MENTHPEKKKRPLALIIVLWLFILSGLANVTVGVLALYVSGLVDAGLAQIEIIAEETEEILTDEAQLLALGILGVVMGVGELLISIGIARQRKWAWVAAMTWQALDLLIHVALAFNDPPDLLSMGTSILLIFVLNQSDVRIAFGITHKQNEPSSPTPVRSTHVN